MTRIMKMSHVFTRFTAMEARTDSINAD